MATRTYEKGDLTVFWDSTRCIHTGICLRSLHSVFNLKNRPWVDVDGADADQIMATIRKCPTGALRYTSGERNAAYYWVDRHLACVLTGPAERAKLHAIAQSAYDQIDSRSTQLGG